MRRWHVDVLRPSRHATYRILTHVGSFTSQSPSDGAMAGRGRLQVSHASNQALTETLNSSTTAREELDAAVARVCERINVPIEDARTQVQLLEVSIARMARRTFAARLRHASAPPRAAFDPQLQLRPFIT
jgi:hypothetical protein